MEGRAPNNLTRSGLKRTLVDELVDDAEAKRYAKKKFEDLQTVRGAKAEIHWPPKGDEETKVVM